MTTSTVNYQGDLRTTAIHLQSNSEIITDAPVDNHGKGQAFSPTDLVATALASCMLTVMAIKAESMQIELAGTSATVTKYMNAEPRRIGRIEVQVRLNQNYDDKTKKILEKTALTCPVTQSLHPDLQQSIEFTYPVS
jgi:uncharacterized OsmC-like protein